MAVLKLFLEEILFLEIRDSTVKEPRLECVFHVFDI